MCPVKKNLVKPLDNIQKSPRVNTTGDYPFHDISNRRQTQHGGKTKRTQTSQDKKEVSHRTKTMAKFLTRKDKLLVIRAEAGVDVLWTKTCDPPKAEGKSGVLTPACRTTPHLSPPEISVLFLKRPTGESPAVFYICETNILLSSCLKNCSSLVSKDKTWKAT